VRQAPQRMGAVTEAPETQYAKTADGAYVAYQVVGNGSLDLVFLPFRGGHVELVWEIPAISRVFRRMASFSRLILFDWRGSGLSDPIGIDERRTLEERSKEVLAVLDAAGSEKAALVANHLGGLDAMFFAASYPNRVSSLVLDGCYARLARAPDYPFGVPIEVLERAITQVRGGKGSVGHSDLTYAAPHALRNDPQFAEQWQRYTRSIYGPGMARAMAEMAVFADVRSILPAIQAPTLVLYRRGDGWIGRPHGEYLAEHIKGAKLVELSGEDNLIFAGDSDSVVDEVEEFLTGSLHTREADRVLATLLFTDIVASTDRAAQLGDQRWRDQLDKHDQTVRRQLERFGGREVNTVGDGFLATFDGPGRAIRCACAIRDSVLALDLEIRAGVHTGEIELRGDDVAGMAVHIGARVASGADPGEVLVSSTVKDLVVGSAIKFQDRGEQELKGVPGSWRLYRVLS
jgi:class 3 adenylate cyclase